MQRGSVFVGIANKGGIMYFRKFIVVFSVLSLMSAACQSPAPQVVEKEVEKIVVQTAIVEVEKVVQVTVEPEPVAAESTWERAKREGVVRVGFANENPYAYAKPDGTLTGVDVEIARLVFKRLGVEALEGVLTEWGGLIPGLLVGRIDAITAGMWIKPERCESVIFSDPGTGVGLGMAGKAGNPLNFHSLVDVAKNPKARFGIVTGGYEEDYALKSGVQPAQIVAFTTPDAAMAGLQAGRIDAFTLGGLAMQIMIDNSKDPGVERILPFTDPVIEGTIVRGYGAVAFRPADTDLRDAYSNEIQKMKASGELLKVIEPFGFSSAELPGDMTQEMLCKGS